MEINEVQIEWLDKGLKPKIKFKSPINIDDGHRNHPQGEKESTMELFMSPENSSGNIEWIVNDGEFVEGIGLWFDDKKELTDYDGVFELPIQAIMMLRELGYTVDKTFEE